MNDGSIENRRNNNIKPIVRVVGNQLQIIFVGNNQEPRKENKEYAFAFMVNGFDTFLDLLIQQIKKSHTLFKNVLRPISGNLGIIGTTMGACGVIFGKDKMGEFLKWSIPAIISLSVLKAVGGFYGWIVSIILGVIYGKIVGVAYDGQTSDSDISMIEMIAAALILMLLPTPPDEGGGGDDDFGGGDDGGNSGGNSPKNPGGVEFRNIKPITGIKSPELFLSSINNIFFKANSEKDILDTFNMLVLPEFRGRNIREYFDTIMKEASDSINSQIDLPFVSLHFNNDGFLYSVMPNFYKKTIIGNVLAFIDYFMKGFVNGGFFNIDFVRTWANSPPNKRITNTDILNAKLINVKTELKKSGNKYIYYPLNELIDQDKTTKDFYSAFRIIGQMKGIGKSNNILFPIESFTVEYDLNTKPEIQKILDSDDPEINEYYKHIQSIYILMKDIIKTTMPQVPQFRGLFPILDMITFAFHYTLSLKSIGKAVNTQYAFQNKGDNINYIPQIPDVFPPLPVADKREVKCTFEMTEVIESIQKTPFNTEVKNIINSEQDEFSQKCLNEIIKEIDAHYRRKISEIIGNQEKLDEETIHIKRFRERIIEFIKNIPNMVKDDLFNLLSFMEDIIKTKDPTIEETPSNLSMAELLIKSRERLTKLTELMKQNDREILEVVNELNNIRHQVQLIKTDLNIAENRIIASVILFKSLNDQIMIFSKAVENFMSSYKEILNKYSYKQQFYIVTPKIKDLDQHNKIVGGCKVNFSKNAMIQIIPKSEKELIEINKIVRDKHKKEGFVHSSNGISGLLMKLEIIPLPTDGANLKYSSLIKKLIIYEEKGPKKVAKIDFKMLIDNLIKTQHDSEKTSNKSPAYKACCCGDIYTISVLIENGADFGQTYQNGVYPFLAAIMGGYHDAVILLLTHPKAKIGDINKSTESGITPLYYAIYYDFPDVIDILLKKGAIPTIPIRSNGMSSVHIACYLDRLECLKIIARSTKENIYIESLGGLTPLQVALAHSPRCAMFLINQKKDINFSVVDPRDHSTYDIAIMNGFYELCKMLPNEGKMKDILKFDQIKQNDDEFNHLCHAFSSGNLEMTEKTLTKWLSHTDPSSLDKKQKDKLVESACAGGCINYIEILSKFLNFEEYPLALSAAHYGLLDWIPEIEKYGGKLMVEVDKKTIFDESVSNSDYEFLKKAFDVVEQVPYTIISRIIKESIKIGNFETMAIISKALLQQKNVQYISPSCIIAPNLSEISFKIYKDNLDPKKKIDLNDFIEIVSSQLISFLISNYQFSKDELKNACKSAINSKRFDNAFAIIRKNEIVAQELRRNEHYKIVDQLTEINKNAAFNSIKELIKDETMPEKQKIEQLKDVFKNNFNIGDLTDEDGYSLIYYAGKDMKNFWILKAISPKYIDQFRLSMQSFHEDMISLLFQKLLKIFESLFGRRKAGQYFLDVLSKIDYSYLDKCGHGNEFITSLLNTMTRLYLLSKDSDNRTIFHYISKISSINDENMKLLISSINNYHLLTKKNVMNQRSRKGETILMNIATTGNLKSIEYIIENVMTKIEISFFNRDIYGDNILHKILKGKNATNDKVIFCISLIIKKCPELILQRNRIGKNPFMLAAEKGFNGVLGLMSTVYPLKVLDSSLEYSVLHLAAIKNHRETIRYLVQVLHIDVNITSNDGFTPLHWAAVKSSTLAYQELISLGANPLIICNKFNKMNAIDFAMEYGAEKMIKIVMESPSFNFVLSKTDILLHLAKNKEGYKGFNEAMKFYHENAINSCNSFGQNIVSLACIHNNRQIVADALMIGGDPEIIDTDGMNSIHTCAEYDSIGCSDLILNYINAIKGSIGIKNILNAKDSNGNLPIHIAARKGFTGFVAHLLCSCIDQDYNSENNSGFTPFSEAVKNGHKKIAGIFVYMIELLKLSPDILIGKLNPELKNKWEKEFLISQDYEYAKEIVDKFKENMWKPAPPPKFKNNQTKEMLPKEKLFDEILKNAELTISKKIMNNYAAVFMNSAFQSTISILLTDKTKIEMVKKIIKSVTIIRSKRLRKIAFLIIFPMLCIDDIDQFIQKINYIDQMQIEESNPLFSWIENGLISIAETNKNPKEINQNIQILIDMVFYISKDEKIKNIVPYPVIPVPVHEFSSFILSMKDEKFKKIQIRFANLTKVSSIWKKEPLLSIDISNRLGDGQKALLKYVLKQKELGEDVIERVIQITIDLYDDPSLIDIEREMIMNKCISIISKNYNPESIKIEFTAWITNSKRIIHEFGINYYNQILPIIPQDSLSIANEALSYILIIGSQDEANIKLIKKGIKHLKYKALRIQNEKVFESRNLDDVLKAFSEGTGEFIPYKFAFDGTPVIKLKQHELESLRVFGSLLEKQPKVINILDTAQERGKAFRDTPTIENAAMLVAIVRQAIQETYDINPFIVQCLTVCSMLLHRINKKKRRGLKGRIAQVATGEGKSIIIAMLAGCIGLTGSCVDIISSSMYLAKRDAEKYSVLYEKLGLRCGIVNENDFSSGFDFHILYSTNVGFEFALLHEGLSGKQIIETTPLYENVKKKRPNMTTIVDEADNLFIDTAMNPAQYSQGGSSKMSWIFKFIWKSVCKMVLNPNKIRQILINNAPSEEQLKDINNISDDQLTTLINNAIRANKLQKDVNYVVGKNKKTNEDEIQIIDADNTGRIRYGCRWSNGLHEFVELKEGIQLHEQTYTVASISHPSFFELYEEIFGLTGTLGEAPERKEILQIYHVDSYDIPPNRKCLRKRDKTLIVSTIKKKEQIIIEKIREMKNKGRPILVLVYSIKDSQRLSDLLRNERIDHFLLNDQQKQDEDFIIERAGLPGSVTIATNTAGRGTDIHIDKNALKNGGLHALITFWPANIRVECQALGRSARQGQPGSCQIIFESEEFGNDDEEPTEETLKNIYEKRTNSIALRTAFRSDLIKKEKLIFAILNQYFDYIFNLRKFLESSESVLNADFDGANSSIILNDLAICWSHFYTSFKDEKDPSENSFQIFLNQWSFDKKYPRLANRYKEFISNENKCQHSPIWSPTQSVDENYKYYTFDNEDLLNNLISLGFEKDLCIKALKRSKNNIEKAIDLLLSSSQKQVNKPDINKKSNSILNELMSMGFDKQSCERALELANNNIEIAITLLLNGSVKPNQRLINSELENKISDLMMMGFNEDKCRDALSKANNDINKAIDILCNQNRTDSKTDNIE